jgi:hypothetical protein
MKDSWQYVEREEEGEMLREATDDGVVNVARYYHHETVRVHGRDAVSGSLCCDFQLLQIPGFTPCFYL